MDRWLACTVITEYWVAKFAHVYGYSKLTNKPVSHTGIYFGAYLCIFSPLSRLGKKKTKCIKDKVRCVTNKCFSSNNFLVSCISLCVSKYLTSGALILLGKKKKWQREPCHCKRFETCLTDTDRLATGLSKCWGKNLLFKGDKALTMAEFLTPFQEPCSERPVSVVR